jgi:integrase
MNTAVEDGKIRRNPCRIKGAGQEYSQERPVVPVGTLIRLLDEVPPRYRALLLLATFANLRFGELAGLRRHHLDLDACVVRVSVSTAETDDGRLIDDDPKSRAGIRTVSFPRDIVPELRWHLECFAQAADDGLVFIGPLGGRLRRKNFRKFWVRARDSVGLPDLHFHDLRHTGNTMAAAQGASLRELMERMGHTSSRAALITPPTWAGTTGAGDGNRTRMTSLEGRWRGSARRQRSGPILLAAGVRGGGVTVTDRRLPSCVARMWHGSLA